MIGRQYLPYATARINPPEYTLARQRRPGSTDYSPLISVAYTSLHGDPEADQLAIGFERRNDEFRQPPKAKEHASAQRARIDALAPWRQSGPAPSRVGSSSRPPRRAGSVRGADKGTPNDALLIPQESAL